MRLRNAVMSLTLLAAGLAAVAPAAPSGAATTVPDWPQYHGGSSRAGYSSASPAYNGRLHVSARITLDGAVYASPIVAGGRTIVATENNTVYAFGPSNQLLWKRHLGAPARSADHPCGNIDPLGITGTPAYYAGTHEIYVAAEFHASPPTHRVYGLDLTTGAMRLSQGLDLPGVDRAVMQQRGALALAHGRVWVPFGGLAGDCGQYKGRLVGVPVTGGGVRTYTVPTRREAGIWTSPGPTVDPSGNLYVAVGNGAAGTNGLPYDFSDSVLELNGSTGAALQHFSPTTWRTDNDADLDLGSQGPAFVGSYVFAAGKSGTAYTLRRGALGGIGGQVSQRSICKSFGGTAVVGNHVYVPCTDGVRSVYIYPNGRMLPVWHNSTANGSPVYGGGIIWTLDTANGILRGLDLATGSRRAGVSVGAVTRFATPALSGNRILVGTTSGLTVLAY
ncbi:MAG TPA: PQQ-binding-like beta-propeller repeat protein [Jatrophihabitans sp.]|jgi:hypothetical protein|uniref:outer membrane protein assembly factor BamB family protein n=1 Tax=Jatrophihabitans sp. TaxID=1932789 RepID=UPI002DFF1CDF|nr:PQQ-binding-like beta-propeller repeat protein [Jatrophihabitans sp.]